MALLSNEIIVWWAVINAIIVQGGKQGKNCSVSDLNSVCPPHSICSQLQSDAMDGQCKCRDEKYVFNVNYKNDTDYCVYDAKSKGDEETQSDDSNRTDQKESEVAQTGSQVSSPDDKTSDGPKIHPLPGAHHVIGGILIPIFFVVVAIGVVYGIRRLHLQQRVRSIRLSRRNRPFYEDVMLGNHDNDDPPLI